MTILAPSRIWRRRAAAWLSALVLCLSGLPPLPVLTAAADPFVAADICSTEHGAPESGGQVRHDCGDHCCLAVAKAPPPTPVAIAPVARLGGEILAATAQPAPPAAPRLHHAPRAPPFPVA